ncbi:MAG: Gfo/Idh/MocA family protein [Promethearchaeota archaeon]
MEDNTRVSRKLAGIVIGAGSRGMDAYAPYLLDHPEEGQIVAIAEPNDVRREKFAERYGVEPGQQYRGYEEVLALDKFADFAIVATSDRLHVEPAIMAMERGYDVLLEKPMAVTEEDCRRLVEVSERTGRLLQICHVLRYAPFFSRIKEIIDSGEIGKVVTIQHSENVSYWHYAHSYCRGLYRNSGTSSPMILAKSCHDLDLLYWFAGSSEPARLTSIARPTELCEENKPEGAPPYCIEGCPHSPTCPYDAVAMYERIVPVMLDIEKTHRAKRAGLIRWFLRQARKRPWVLHLLSFGKTRKLLPWKGWPVNQVVDVVTRENLEEALRTTPWGRCVYQVGDNDQVSSQTVNVLFSSGVNASFTMHSTSYIEGRETRIDGTKGSIHGVFYALDQVIKVVDHKTGETREEVLPVKFDAHGGGDKVLFAGFLKALRGDAPALTTARQSLWSHLMAFAADRAQREGIVVDWRGE